MSLKISNLLGFRSGWQRVLPIFLFLWLGGGLFAAGHLISLESHLKTIEEDELSRLLDLYHREQQQKTLFGGTPLQGGQLPVGLLFLRIIDGNEQILLVDSSGEAIDFRRLAELSPELNGVWLLFEQEGFAQTRLSLLTRDLVGGVSLQAGKDSNASYELFRDQRRNTILLVLASAALAWPLAHYLVLRSLAPLAAIRARIRRLKTTGGNQELLPEKGGGPELDGLCREINQVIGQNRQLLQTIQQSLDNLAHDLRTPMTRLRSVAEYGLQGGADSDRLQEALSDCLEESERLLAMLGVMMSVAEAETKTMRLEQREFDLADAWQKVVTLYEYVAAEKDISVQLDASSPLIFTGDEARLARVWANLLDNAIKYGQQGGWVRISVKKQKDMLELVVADNGMGISKGEQPRIWERLYRGDRSRSEKGLGLGLNYAKAVVEAHQGSIRVQSDVHKGSRFMVSLPLQSQLMAEKSQTRGV